MQLSTSIPHPTDEVTDAVGSVDLREYVLCVLYRSLLCVSICSSTINQQQMVRPLTITKSTRCVILPPTLILRIYGQKFSSLTHSLTYLLFHPHCSCQTIRSATRSSSSSSSSSSSDDVESLISQFESLSLSINEVGVNGNETMSRAKRMFEKFQQTRASGSHKRLFFCAKCFVECANKRQLAAHLKEKKHVVNKHKLKVALKNSDIALADAAAGSREEQSLLKKRSKLLLQQLVFTKIIHLL